MISDLILRLIEFHKSEWWQAPISDSELYKYFEILIGKGRIVFQYEKDEMVGYCESWRINFEQMGRILCGEPFHAGTEDVNNGNIAYVANVHILKEFRKGEAIRNLKLQFFKQNFMCTHFVGEARRKKSQPFKCFKRQEAIKKYFKEEV